MTNVVVVVAAAVIVVAAAAAASVGGASAGGVGAAGTGGSMFFFFVSPCGILIVIPKKENKGIKKIKYLKIILHKSQYILPGTDTEK